MRMLSITILLILLGLVAPPAKAQTLIPYQSIPTQGAVDWDFFEFDGRSFLAVANESDGSSYFIDSVIFEWDGAAFTPFQTLATERALDWEYFEEGGERYLIYASQTSDAVSSFGKIYRWDGTQFVDHQLIGSKGASDSEAFFIDGALYIAQAYSGNPTIEEPFSWVSDWDGSFINGYQQIPTTSADEFQYFEIGTRKFLTVVDGPNSAGDPEQSRILEWDGSQFNDFQPLVTDNGTSVDFIDADGTPLLVTSSAGANGNAVTSTRVLAWDGAQFVERQVITVTSAFDAELFEAYGQVYLATGNRSDTDSSGRFDAQLYAWNGFDFDLVETFDTGSAYDLEAFAVDGTWYLAAANNFENGSKLVDSTIFRIVAPDDPQVTAVVDVPNDQGRRVRITVARSAQDAAGAATPILQYEIYRKIEAGLAAGAAVDPSTRIADARARGMISDDAVLASGWDFDGAFPAHGDDEYNALATTLADSNANGMRTSTFFVRAATAVPTTYFDSAPATGYSVDNLAPLAPTGARQFDGNDETTITWTENTEDDFYAYRVYQGPTEGFEVTLGNHVLETAATSVQLSPTAGAYFSVTAVDVNGNESAVAQARLGNATSAPGIARVLQSVGNAPNPFNPSTKIQFSLGRDATVRLRIFDARGRRVVTLVENEARTAGPHEVVWRGTDAAGQPVVSGVYRVQVEAEGEIVTGRMVLVK